MTTSPTRRPTEPETKPKPALTVNKVVAGAAAAATSAVAGSFYGATGTIVGAALGSITLTVAASVYEHSLDRARERVHARVRLLWRGGADPEATQVLRAMPPAGGRTRAGYAPRQTKGRRWLAPVAGSVLVFVLGLAAVTGVELLKGSQLGSADEGTSVGRVVSGGGSSTRPTSSAPKTTTASTSKTSVPAPPTETAEPTATPTSADHSGSGGSPGSGRDKAQTAVPAAPTPADSATTPDVTASGG